MEDRAIYQTKWSRKPKAKVIEFFVAGTPATAGSKTPFIYKSKVNGKQRVAMCPANKKQKPWMAQVRAVAVEHYSGEPITKAIDLYCRFFLPRPKSHYGSGKNSGMVKDSAPEEPTGKPDLFKLVRAVEDALTSIIWRDDSQIITVNASKRYHDKPGVEIRIEEK